MSDSRTNKALALGKLLALPMPQLTDEEWAERDEENRRENEERSLEIEEHDLARRAMALAKQGVSRRILDSTSKATEATRELSRIMDGAGCRIVVLAGGVGSGKTTAATQWLWHAKRTPWWTTAVAFARNNRYERQQPWMSAHMGVIDDLGVEYSDKKGSYQTDLDEVVDHFYSAGKRLVMTTNLTPTAFLQRYRHRIRSRVKECGEFITLKTRDMRGNQ